MIPLVSVPNGTLFSTFAKSTINMVKHIILWTLNPELSEVEKKAVKAGIKEGLALNIS